MAAIVEAVGCAVFLLLYTIDDSVFQNGLSAILSRIDIRNAFNNFASNNIFDITGPDFLSVDELYFRISDSTGAVKEKMELGGQSNE